MLAPSTPDGRDRALLVAVDPGRTVRYRARVDRLGRSLEPFGLVAGRRPRPAAVEYFVAA